MLSKSKYIALGFSLIALVCALTILVSFLNMQESASPSPSGDSNTPIEYSDDGFPVVDWDYWKSINPDVIGWVTVPGTVIDYPILQAQANAPEFYLHHDVYKNWSVYGVPYLDAQNLQTGGLFNSKNAIVFGHHMNDGTMFAAFADYSNKAFAEEHNQILVQSPTEKAVLNVNMAQIVKGSDNAKRISFLDDQDYSIWYENSLAESDMVLDSESRPDHIITFVTCSYNYSSNERTIVLSSIAGGKAQ